MNTAGLLAGLRRCVPEFSADDLFIDLPYVVFGEFADFVAGRIHKYGIDDPVVIRSFDFVNDLFIQGDREVGNLIETTFFERLADDRRLSTVAEALLEGTAQEAFEHIAKWAGNHDD